VGAKVWGWFVSHEAVDKFDFCVIVLGGRACKRWLGHWEGQCLSHRWVGSCENGLLLSKAAPMPSLPPPPAWPSNFHHSIKLQALIRYSCLTLAFTSVILNILLSCTNYPVSGVLLLQQKMD
jgi:hypothetical protein